MAFYKDPAGGLHFLSEEEIQNGGVFLLPAECVTISDAEAEAIQNPPITLDAARSIQTELMTGAYMAAVQVSVLFTTVAGVTKTFQADMIDNDKKQSSQTILLKTLTGYNMTGALPSGFYWKSEDNTRVPFTLADLRGLYGAMLTQGDTAFLHLQDRKNAINSAATVADVQAIAW